MTEFDFDELDKAVSSLMKKTPAEDTDADDSQSTTTRSDFTNPSAEAVSSESPETMNVLELSPAEDTGPTNSVTSEDSPRQRDLDTTRSTPYSAPYAREDTSTDASSATVIPAAAPPINRNISRDIVTKRRGTFMDVVHPSSDMRSKQKTNPAKLFPRQEAVIVPPVSERTSPAEEKSDVELTPRPFTVMPRVTNDRELFDTLSENVERESTKPETEPVVDFGYNDIEDSKLDNEFTTPVMEQELVKPSSPPQNNESLFISDAKVDKRPLGAQLTDASADAPSEMTGLAEKADSPIRSQLPDELSHKIMAVESEREVTAVPTMSAATRTSRPQPYSSAVQKNSPAQTVARHTAQSPSQPVPSKPAEVEEDHPGIYDPAYYKQEAKPKAAKKSGLWAVLGIVGLIVLGGAGGVLYYFYSTGSISF